jgi:hypothetical protein
LDAEVLGQAAADGYAPDQVIDKRLNAPAATPAAPPAQNEAVAKLNAIATKIVEYGKKHGQQIGFAKAFSIAAGMRHDLVMADKQHRGIG